MEYKSKTYNRLAALVLFIGMPVLLFFLDNFPRRSFISEAISLTTIIAFFMLLLQFFLSRANSAAIKEYKMSKLIKWHKVLGYIFITILLLHPFLLVLPKCFDSTLTPTQAFVNLLKQWSNLGVLLGVLAYILMFIIGLTSIFKNSLGLRYKTWRMIHGILSMLFVAIAAFHVIRIGRHMSVAFIILIALVSVFAISLLLKIYLFPKQTNTNNK